METGQATDRSAVSQQSQSTSRPKKEFAQQKQRIEPITDELLENCPLPITDRK